MLRLIAVVSILLTAGVAYGEEANSGYDHEGGGSGGEIRYYPTGYEINGRRYFYNNFCFPGRDMHHGVEPSWPSLNPPYYQDWWYYNY